MSSHIFYSLLMTSRIRQTAPLVSLAVEVIQPSSTTSALPSVMSSSEVHTTGRLVCTRTVIPSCRSLFRLPGFDECEILVHRIREILQPNHQVSICIVPTLVPLLGRRSSPQDTPDKLHGWKAYTLSAAWNWSLRESFRLAMMPANNTFCKSFTDGSRGSAQFNNENFGVH